MVLNLRPSITENISTPSGHLRRFFSLLLSHSKENRDTVPTLISWDPPGSRMLPNLHLYLHTPTGPLHSVGEGGVSSVPKLRSCSVQRLPLTEKRERDLLWRTLFMSEGRNKSCSYLKECVFLRKNENRGVKWPLDRWPVVTTSRRKVSKEIQSLKFFCYYRCFTLYLNSILFVSWLWKKDVSMKGRRSRSRRTDPCTEDSWNVKIWRRFNEVRK